MIYFFIGWYILGVIGGLICSKWDNPKEYVNLFDLLMSLIFGGVMGIVMLAIGLFLYTNNCPKNIFKKKLF